METPATGGFEPLRPALAAMGATMMAAHGGGFQPHRQGRHLLGLQVRHGDIIPLKLLQPAVGLLH
jgi:hypothetical protein